SLSSLHISVLFYFYPSLLSSIFFFNDPATTEIYTLSLHDALPICSLLRGGIAVESSDVQSEKQQLPYFVHESAYVDKGAEVGSGDRKSTRLNSSHGSISYAVFCLKKKKKKTTR